MYVRFFFFLFSLPISLFFPLQNINCRVTRRSSVCNHKRNLTNISCRFSGNPLYVTSRASYEPNSPETARNDNNFPWYVVPRSSFNQRATTFSSRLITARHWSRVNRVNFAVYDVCICISQKSIFSANAEFCAKMERAFDEPFSRPVCAILFFGGENENDETKR